MITTSRGEHTITSLYTFGSNRAGQLGVGTDVPESPTPVLVDFFVLNGLDVCELACGMHHTLASTTDPAFLFSWGFGESGRLGLGTEDMQSEPHRVPIPQEEIIDLAAGEQHSLALLESGALFAWGSNNFGQLGLGMQKNGRSDVMIPTKLALPAHIEGRRVACGARHSALITESGRLLLWGWGEEGQLGNKKERNAAKPQAVQLPRVNDTDFVVDSVALGTSHSMVLCRNPSVTEELAMIEQDGTFQVKPRREKKREKAAIEPDEEFPPALENVVDMNPLEAVCEIDSASANSPESFKPPMSPEMFPMTVEPPSEEQLPPPKEEKPDDSEHERRMQSLQKFRKKFEHCQPVRQRPQPPPLRTPEPDEFQWPEEIKPTRQPEDHESPPTKEPPQKPKVLPVTPVEAPVPQEPSPKRLSQEKPFEAAAEEAPPSPQPPLPLLKEQTEQPRPRSAAVPPPNTIYYHPGQQEVMDNLLVAHSAKQAMKREKRKEERRRAGSETKRTSKAMHRRKLLQIYG